MNTILISGNLGHTPKVEKTRNGKTILRSSIAYTEVKDGEKVTSWFDFVAFNGTAELIEKNFEKGDKIGLIGKLCRDDYEKDNEKKTKYYVMVNMVEFYKRSTGGYEPVAEDEGDLPF